MLVAQLFVKLVVDQSVLRGPDPVVAGPYESFVDCG